MAFSIPLPFGKRAPASAPPGAGRETVLDTVTAAAAAPRPTLPFIGHLPVERQYSLIGISLILWLLCLLVVVVKDVRDAGQLADGVAISGETLMHSQRLAKAVPGAVLGNPASFGQLLESRDRIAINLLALSGEGEKGLQTPQRAELPLAAVREEWAKTEKNASVVLEQQKNLLVLGESIRAINANNPQLLELAEQVAALKLAGGANQRDITATSQLVMLTQRMAKNANALIAGETIDPEVAFLLGKDTNTFRDLLNALIRGNESLRIAPSADPEIRARLGDLERSFAQYQQAVAGILGNLQRLVAAKQSAQRIFADNEKLKQGLEEVAKGYAAELDGRAINYIFMAVFGVLAAASIALMFFAYRADADQRRQRAEKEENEARALNAQNQAAILRLMNELAEVADGNLTVTTTVNEDITGAIADSVNLTIEELRGVVMRINQATAQVTLATQTAQETSARLLAAQDRQSTEIRDSGESVLRMARDIGEVSRGARQSAEVARQSVGAAQKGVAAVQDSIAGMNDIREQIQETSKRIKRLGESSQEIGEIVELISDITEQTNVLALNAAIQAASAGEAGRGFSVVAEEVQRLAERSAEATRQIGAIVKAIQTDTQDAVSAMEKSTRGVVEGAKLADAAGQALAEIGTVSGRLSELIEGFAGNASSQADSAAIVARSIEDILRVSEEATAGTRSTADSVRELATLAQELKSSVSGFKVA
jgi:twitching motility protein PilJ